jgi:acetyltransferase-like isoleucine patch superfamily enzyme
MKGVGRALALTGRVYWPGMRTLWRARWLWLRLRVGLDALMCGSRVRFTVGPNARIDSGVGVEVLPGTRTHVVIGAGSWLGQDSHFQLGGGQLVVGDDVILRRGFRAVVGGDISIGDHCVFGWGVSLHCMKRVTIGANVGLSENVIVVDSRHLRPPLEEQAFHHAVAEETEIKAGAWLAANVVVFAGVTIGTGAFIGANSAVSKDVPDGWFAAGLPAKPIRELEIEVGGE